MNKLFFRVTSLALCILMALGCCISALGAKIDPDSVLDPTKTGKLSVTISRANGNPVPGGKVSIYLVAEAVHSDYQGDTLVYVAPFDSMADAPALDYDAFMSGFSTEAPGDGSDSGNKQNAAVFSGFVKNNPDRTYTAQDVEVNDAGLAEVNGLPLGLYLVLQKDGDAATGYYTIKPFLITVPGRGEDSKLVYEVDAKPKTEPTKPIPSPKPTPDNPEVTPPTGETLPQTGQLKRPVPVLAVSGMVVFAFGWVLRKRQKEN